MFAPKVAAPSGVGARPASSLAAGRPARSVSHQANRGIKPSAPQAAAKPANPASWDFSRIGILPPACEASFGEMAGALGLAETSIRVRSDTEASRFLDRNRAAAATVDRSTILVRPERRGDPAVMAQRIAELRPRRRRRAGAPRARRPPPRPRPAFAGAHRSRRPAPAFPRAAPGRRVRQGAAERLPILRPTR